ncbi:DUF3577 domain-containing protein, partial [Klebsiella pneumoniae]|uniref:DUF3577 domain-containing protein n=1 Tax=Klebsiella pneumoniae TaxID=573 RepID=UPI0035B339EA
MPVIFHKRSSYRRGKTPMCESFFTCSINALTGATDNPGYTRFDIMVVGKESSELILRCQKAIAEEK